LQQICNLDVPASIKLARETGADKKARDFFQLEPCEGPASRHNFPTVLWSQRRPATHCNCIRAFWRPSGGPPAQPCNGLSHANKVRRLSRSFGACSRRWSSSLPALSLREGRRARRFKGGASHLIDSIIELLASCMDWAKIVGLPRPRPCTCA